MDILSSISGYSGIAMQLAGAAAGGESQAPPPRITVGYSGPGHGLVGAGGALVAVVAVLVALGPPVYHALAAATGVAPALGGGHHGGMHIITGILRGDCGKKQQSLS